LRFFDFENEARSRSASRENSFEEDKDKNDSIVEEVNEVKDQNQDQTENEGQNESSNEAHIETKEANGTMGASLTTKPESDQNESFIEDLDKFKKRRQDTFPDQEKIEQNTRPKKIPKIDLTDDNNQKVI